MLPAGFPFLFLPQTQTDPISACINESAGKVFGFLGPSLYLITLGHGHIVSAILLQKEMQILLAFKACLHMELLRNNY